MILRKEHGTLARVMHMQFLSKKMKGQLSFIQPVFIKDSDCTKDIPVRYGVPDKQIYGSGKRINPRNPGRQDTEHFKSIYLENLLPLEEYDLIAILLSGGKDSII